MMILVFFCEITFFSTLLLLYVIELSPRHGDNISISCGSSIRIIVLLTSCTNGFLKNEC